VPPVREVPLTVLRGFAMGSADIVPGVSGGTVALVLGIYRRLVASIRAGSLALGRLIRADRRGAVEQLRTVEWLFLLPLLAGILTAVITLSGLLERLLHDHPAEMAGLFLGLVAGSAVVAWQLLTRRDLRSLAVLVAVAALTFGLLGIPGSTSTSEAAGGSTPAAWAFFASGAVAICAMILPGISGSFMLVAMGMYGSVLGAVNDRDLASLAVFVAGCVVGLALFSRLLHWALSEHYDDVTAGLIGLMVGSLRVLWPWPDGVESTALGGPDGAVALVVGLAVVAAVAVVGLNLLATRLERRTTADETAEIRSV
jgi:putative membrane protein